MKHRGLTSVYNVQFVTFVPMLELLLRQLVLQDIFVPLVRIVTSSHVHQALTPIFRNLHYPQSVWIVQKDIIVLATVVRPCQAVNANLAMFVLQRVLTNLVTIGQHFSMIVTMMQMATGMDPIWKLTNVQLDTFVLQVMKCCHVLWELLVLEQVWPIFHNVPYANQACFATPLD
jgi:hypothetical protein